jgi:ankyrin repeat protein
MNVDQRLFQAVSECRIPEIRALVLTSGANVAAVHPDDSATCLHWSSGSGHYGVTRVLLELGSPINARNAKGETPCITPA